MSKTLIAYFSARVAEQIAAAADAVLYDIIPTQPYTSADLDWTDKKAAASLKEHCPEAFWKKGALLKGIDVSDWAKHILQD